MQRRYDHINVPMELLRTLDAVAEQGTLTRAAAHLEVTQPAITSQIKCLQEILRVPVFSRESGVRGLTPEITALMPTVRRILALNDQLLLEARGSNSKAAISVGLAMFFSVAYLPKFLTTLRSDYPNIDVQIETSASSDLKIGIDNLVYDVVVSVGAPPDRYVAVHEWREPVSWVASNAFEMSPGQPIPVVSMPKNFLQADALRQLTNSGGIFSVPVIAHDWNSLLGALRASCGVAVLPTRYVPPDLRIVRTSFLPELPEHSVGIFVADHNQTERSLMVANLLHELAFPKVQKSSRAGDAA